MGQRLQSFSGGLRPPLAEIISFITSLGDGAMSDAVARTSRAARASLVLGLLCLFFGLMAVFTLAPVLALGVFVFFLPALVLGIVAYVRIHRNAGWLHGEGIASWGIGATIAGALVSLMIPAT
jgi:hypothetical protein